MDMHTFFGPNRNTVLRTLFTVLIFIMPSLNNAALAAESMQRIDSAAYADPARVATDNDGNAIAVWTQFDAAPSRAGVWVNRFVANRGWGTPQLINANPGQASDARIAMNARGDAVVVWMQYSDSVAFKVNIWSNRYSKDTGWDQARQIQDDTANGYFAKVGIDNHSNAIAVWAQNDPAQDRTHIYANRYTAGQGWGTGTPIQNDNVTLANDPQMAMDADGNASVVWVQYTAPQRGIWTNRYTSGSGWTVAQNIGNDTASAPTVAVDNRGNAIAAWLQPDPTSNQNNVYARHYAGGQWEPLARLQSDTQADARALQLAMNTRDNAVALWEERLVDYGSPSGFSSAVYANDYIHARGWGAAQRVDDSTQYTNTSLAIDDNDNVVAAWERDNSAQVTQNIYVYRHDLRRGWDAGELIGRVQDNAGYPRLSASNNGTSALVWQLQDSTGVWSLWGDVFATASTRGVR